MTKSNNADAFKILRNMMQTSGVWPERNPDVLYSFKTTATWIISVTFGFSLGVEVINDISDITKLSEILYIMTAVTAYVIKLGSFTYQKQTFLGIVEFLKDPVFVSYPDDLDHYMAKTIKTSTLIANIYRYLCLCGCIMFAVYPVMDNTPLPFLFSYNLGRYRSAFYVFQIAGISCSAWNNSCLDTLVTSLIGIGNAQLDILTEKVIRISTRSSERKNLENSNDVNIIKQLKQCIEHHIAVVKIVENVEKVFTLGLLLQFLASVVVICNTMFCFVLSSGSLPRLFMLANYFIIMLSQLFMYCWYGNEVILKSGRIREACYNCNWYNCGNEVRKHLFIIMERSKRPLSVTALKFSKLSLPTLMSVLQWSYSYLALLLKMYSKKSALR